MPFELIADPFDAAAEDALTKGLSYREAGLRFERCLLKAALVRAGGKKESAAAALYISRATMYRKDRHLFQPMPREVAAR